MKRYTRHTSLFGVGPVIAAITIGDAGGIARFPSRSHFAAWNGTAPIEVSSGGKKVYRLSLRSSQRVNYAIHIAAVTQIRHKHSPGRAYYKRKIAQGKTGKEALRALKRRISDAIYVRLRADAGQVASGPKDPGGQPGNDSESSAAGSRPVRQLFGQATPGPRPSLRPATRPRRAPRPTPATKLRNTTWHKEDSICAADGSSPIICQDTPIRSIRVLMSSGSARSGRCGTGVNQPQAGLVPSDSWGRRR